MKTDYLITGLMVTCFFCATNAALGQNLLQELTREEVFSREWECARCGRKWEMDIEIKHKMYIEELDRYVYWTDR